MTLNAAIEAELPFLRAEAESRMLDTFDVKVSTGRAYDGDVTTETFDTLFSTKGRVKVSGGLGVNDAQAGDRTVTTVTRELHIPYDSAAIPTGAVAVCTAVAPTSDPTLLGAKLRLAGPAPGSQTTARRLTVEEILT